MLGKAIALAASEFKGKKDKGGKPYILHCLRVMNSVEHLGEVAMCAAVLHDIIEDTEHTVKSLLQNGMSMEVCMLVRALTHDKGMAYDTYIKNISRNELATTIKLADLVDNSDITRLKGLTKRDFDRMEKYHKSYTYLSKI